MLDPKYVRENPDVIKDLIRSGRGDPDKANVEEWLQLDEERSKLLTRIGEVNERRNQLAELGSKGKVEEVRKEGKELKEEVQKLEEELEKVNTKWQELLNWMPNIPVKPLPKGRSEEDNVVLKLWLPDKGYVKDAEGKKARGQTESYMDQKPYHAKDKDFIPKHHLDIGEELGVIDVEQSAKASGSRFSYLKGDLVLLQYGLQQLLFNELLRRGYTPFVPPLLVREKVLYGTSHFPEGKDQVYAIQTDNVEDKSQLYLVGSSEPSNFAYFMDKVMDEKDLPFRLFAYTTAFRSEAGSWGKDVKGIKRVHQFDKIEMNAVTKEDQSQDMFQEFLSINEWLLKTLELPYQIALKCTGDSGYLASAYQADPEVWLPGEDQFLEVMTDTNTTDYQARRLNIKYRDENGVLKYAHTVNDTGCAMGRMLISIICNYQQKDGSVLVPKALNKLVHLKVIKKANEK